MKVKSESEVAQSCPTLSDPMDCSPPGSSIHGIFPGKSTGVGCHCLLRCEAQDLNIEWYMKVAAAVENAIQCCRVICDKEKRATTQTTLDHFFQEASCYFIG